MRPRLICGFTALALALAAAPGTTWAAPRDDAAQWSAQLRYAGEFAGIRIAAQLDAPTADRITIGSVATPSPDLLFTSAGAIEPPPPPCIQPNPQQVRCPLDGLEAGFIELGVGDDDVRVTVGQVGFGDSLGKFRFLGGLGNDSYRGGSEDDIFDGGPGDDLGITRGGRDRLIGGTGADRLFGGPGIDIFRGGPGDDFARGGKGDDRGFGGPGDDDFRD
jgi:Ca2+-binding RTX toxin-like protein